VYIIVYVASRDSDEGAEVIQSPTDDLNKAIATAKSRVNLFAGAAAGQGLAGFIIENEAGDQVHRWYRDTAEGQAFR
jgi:hypothetical protein